MKLNPGAIVLVTVPYVTDETDEGWHNKICTVLITDEDSSYLQHPIGKTWWIDNKWLEIIYEN